MPALSLAVPHTLNRDEVVKRLKSESNLLQSSFSDQVQDFEETWNDHTLTFRFKTFGMSIDGEVSVEPAEVRTTANVPLAAMMFKGAIEAKVRSRLEEILGKSK